MAVNNGDADAAAALRREEALAADCAFFDEMVNLIPSSYYYPNESAAPSVPLQYQHNVKGKNKKQKANSGKTLNAKKRGPPQTVLQMQQEMAEKLHLRGGKKGKKSKGRPAQGNSALEAISDLRQRLHQRIQELQPPKKKENGRGRIDRRKFKAAAVQAEAANNTAQQDVDMSPETQPKQKTKKQKKPKSAAIKLPAEPATEPSTEDHVDGKKQKKKKKKKQKKRLQSDKTDALDFQYGQLDAAPPSAALLQAPEPGKKKKKKEQLLQEALQFQQKLETLDIEKKEEVLYQTKVQKALLKAQGVKVKDDPKLLKKAIKREKREKAKRRKNWEARVAAVEEAKDKRVARRNANLQARAQNKKNRRLSKKGGVPPS